VYGAGRFGRVNPHFDVSCFNPYLLEPHVRYFGFCWPERARFQIGHSIPIPIFELRYFDVENYTFLHYSRTINGMRDLTEVKILEET
jgi:hypothetical protein